MRQYGRLTNLNYGRLLFAGSWLVYFTLYIGRHNLSAVVPLMISEGVVTEGIYGTIAMCFFLCYGVGQLINGIIGDKTSPFALVFVGAFSSGVLNLLMAFLPGVLPGYTSVVLAVCWGLNGYVQSMIWSPLIRIIATVMPQSQRLSASINMSSSTVAGTLTAYLVSSAALACSDWKAAFIAAAASLTVAALIWAAISVRITSIVKNIPIQTTAAETSADCKVKSGEKLLPLLASSGVLLIMLPVTMQGMLNYGVTTWVPTILTDSFSIFREKPQYATLLTMILPVVNLLGAYICHLTDKKLFKNEMKTCALFFGISAVSLAVMYFCIDNSIIVIVAMLALVTSSMTAVNVLCLTFVPMYFGAQGRSSSVAGVLDAIAYVGCAISTYGIGKYVESSQNWAATVLLWCACGALAVAFSLLACGRWGRFRNKNEL